MSCYYKNRISFLILILSLKGFLEDFILICPEEFADDEENSILCIFNINALIASNCKPLEGLQFIVYPEVICSSEPLPGCSGTLAPGYKLSSCGCINQSVSDEEYIFQLLFKAKKSIHLNKEISCVPCYPIFNVEQKTIGSCDSMKFKNASIVAPAAKGIAPTGPELSTWRTIIIFINTILSLLSSF